VSDEQLFCRLQGENAMDKLFDRDKRKLLSLACHGSIFFSSLIFSAGIPLAILLVSDDEVVKTTAKEALNFHLNVWVYGGILAFLAFTIIGLPIVWLLSLPFALFNLVPPVLAILKSLGDPDKPYRYPFIWRVL
jgi:hypothetical protein